MSTITRSGVAKNHCGCKTYPDANQMHGWTWAAIKCVIHHQQNRCELTLIVGHACHLRRVPLAEPDCKAKAQEKHFGQREGKSG
mmetsp:Transcript_45292/g.75039  ORF Transcript_45292/g.75039 Transcript_45292/m.75039 type:complete len:84 (-) Transcript_45292:140-391(-)